MLKKMIKRYRSIPVAAKASLWFIFCSVLQKCVSMLTTPIFTRLMSTEQYGQFTVYNSWLQIFTIFVTLRLNYAVFNKGMSKYKDDRDGYTSTMQTVTFVLALVLFLIYLPFRRQINAVTELPTFIMVAIFAELLFTPAIDFWTIRKRYEYIYKPVVFRTLLMAFLNAGLGVVAVMVSAEKGYARIMSCVLVNMVFGVSLFIYNRSKGKVWFKKEYARFAILFNIPLLMHYISQYILDQFDRIMIQKMVSIAAAGLYGVAYNAAMVMKIVTQSVNNALVPWQYEKLEKQEFRELDDVLFLIFIGVSVCAFMFSSFAPEIMRIMAPAKYYQAVYVIPPVAVGLVFSFMYTAFANVEFFYDQNKFTMYISMAGALLNIVLNYFGIKWFGFIAAAYTTLFCYIVFALCHYIYMTSSVRKALGVSRVFQSGRLVVLSAAVLAVTIFMIFFYDKIVIRYGINLAILLAAWLKRDFILTMYRKVRRKKQK